MMYNDVQNILSRTFKNGDFASRVAVNKLEGWSTVNKFGAGVATTTTRTIYENMATVDYPFLIDTNVTMTIESTSAGDTGQTIEVEYTEHISSNNTWVNKIGRAISNGLTPVTVQEIDEDDNIVGDANIMIPFRMTNMGVDITNSGGLVGTITLENGGIEYNRIDDGNNQSLSSVFVVPSGFTIIIHGVGRSVVGNNRECEFQYKAMTYGEPSQVKRLLFLTQGAEYENFEIPFVFQDKTILSVSATLATGTATVSAWYDALLVKTSEI